MGYNGLSEYRQVLTGQRNSFKIKKLGAELERVRIPSPIRFILFHIWHRMESGAQGSWPTRLQGWQKSPQEM